MKYIFSFLLTAIFVVGVSAQQIQNSEPEIKICGDFKMPVIVPPGDFDSPMIIAPLSDDASEFFSINPCVKAETERTESSKNTSLKNIFAPKKR